MNNFNELNSFDDNDEIAIIGMVGRFPGANNVDKFWQNLRDGVESITCFTDEELVSAGIDSAVLRDPNYVKAGSVLEDIDLFDASFFGFTPREAEITDPQHRLFLESAWEALENAGYNSETYTGRIGLYAGVAFSSYFFTNLYPNRDLTQLVDDFQTFIGNDKDHLPTQTSYKLNLTGPSVNVQTTCSTSLVAVHLACQSLLNGESDIALAGGVSIQVPQKAGYLYQEGGINSPDGHCRAFDANAQGTVFGDGLGIVVLKRLADALADRDYIHAVIKGSAINNDGSLKVGYTAPSVDGQREVILEALALAGVEPETITYIETHGTGTPLGDPIEIAALTQAFRRSSDKKGFCAIGSAKTNVGHLNTAAGVTGLIKTVQALKNKQIPPSLHFQQPNPQIDFANSPFYVNTKLTEWKTDGTPRRAGVSSFGIGGTNAHVILEEAPVV
ncbi:polyketide synthase, partial [Fischerella thermalis]|uniref:type I polyketide synthase n=1 Tax=Fischerella thermalis TaxID=372787 RepID=UPI00307CF38C